MFANVERQNLTEQEELSRALIKDNFEHSSTFIFVIVVNNE